MIYRIMHDAPILNPMPLFTRIQSTSRHSGHARAWALALSLALSSTGLWAVDAPTLSSSCEQFKTVLVGRMDPSIRGYSMEAMPANATVPTGGKVIGTCDGGATKIVYYRFGAPTPSASSAPVATQPVRTVASATPVPAPTVAVPAVVAPPVPTAPSTPVQAAPTKPAVELTAPANTAPAQVAAETPTEASTSVSVQIAEFMAGKWQWLLAFLALALSAAAWAWWMHHNAYDAAGLPRGPKL